jgi:DNA-directed RNA polymerase subunit RPC12/RpoP
MRSCSCPKCNADITIHDENRDFAFCEYCGTKIMLDDFRATHRFVDEASIKKTEVAQSVRLKELEMISKQRESNNRIRSTYLIICFALVIILFLVSYYISIKYEPFFAWFFLAFGGVFLIVAFIPLTRIVFSNTDNNHIEIDTSVNVEAAFSSEQTAQSTIKNNSNYIKLPKLRRPLEEMDYRALSDELEALGFEDINSICLKDIKFGSPNYEQISNTIESFTIGGVDGYFQGKKYPKDIKIIIRYHYWY